MVMTVNLDRESNEVVQGSGASALRRLFWRVHFWAGLITTPIILFAALTGLLYVFTPEIEAWRHGGLDHVPVAQELVSLDQQVEAALQAFPDQAVRYVVPAHHPGHTTQVVLRPPHEHHAAMSMTGAGNSGQAGKGEHGHGLPRGSIVYINPANAEVVGSLQEMERFKTWAKRLHSSALQGNSWRWIIELGASWMLLMLITGIVMWWPRSQAQGGRGWQALVPRVGRGRLTWRDAHALLGLAMGLVLAVLMVTGLTWSRQAGENFRSLQKALAQEAPKPPSNLQSTRPPGATPLSWQVAYALARDQAPDISLQLTPPQGAQGVWRIENFDRDQPTKRFQLALDAYSGSTLFATAWRDLPLFAKSTAVGIPFHRGEFGLWNRVLLVLAALVTLFSVVSGWVMWWKRRPQGSVAAPSLTLRQLKGVPGWLWLMAGVLCWALPVWGWSVLALVATELAGALVHRGFARAL